MYIIYSAHFASTAMPECATTVCSIYLSYFSYFKQNSCIYCLFANSMVYTTTLALHWLTSPIYRELKSSNLTFQG